VWACAFSWAAAVVSAAVAIWAGSLPAIVSSLNAAVATAGWFYAARQWHQWREVSRVAWVAGLGRAGAAMIGVVASAGAPGPLLDRMAQRLGEVAREHEES